MMQICTPGTGRPSEAAFRGALQATALLLLLVVTMTQDGVMLQEEACCLQRTTLLSGDNVRLVLTSTPGSSLHLASRLHSAFLLTGCEDSQANAEGMYALVERQLTATPCPALGKAATHLHFLPFS